MNYEAFENLELIPELLEQLKKLEQKVSSEKRWFNVAETANYLGYSKDHIHKLKAEYFQEGVHFHKKAGRVLFDKIELDKWVTSNINLMQPKDIANEVLKDLI